MRNFQKIRSKKKLKKACGKVRCPSEAMAEEDMKRINTEAGRYGPRRAYLCNDCHGWHLTRSERHDPRFDNPSHFTRKKP